jgi:hypothetical protein
LSYVAGFSTLTTKYADNANIVVASATSTTTLHSSIEP